MRFTFFAFVAFVVLSSVTTVATIAQSQTTITIQSGASFATWGGDGVKELDDQIGLEYRPGLTGRISFTVPFSESAENFLALQLGLAYTRKGMRVFEGDDDSHIELSTTMNYIEVPVLLKVSPQLEGRFAPHLAVGPTLSYALRCEVYSSFRVTLFDEVLDETETEKCPSDEEDGGYNKFDFGLSGGVGVSFEMTPKLLLTLDFIYNYGLGKIVDFGEGLLGDGESDQIHNRAYAIMLGVSIPLRSQTN